MPDGDRRLRILHLTAGSDAGGVSRYIHDLSAAMHANGHAVAIAGEHGAWHGLFENVPWPWVDVPLKGNLADLIRATRTLRRFIRDFAPDVIHAHYRRATLVGERLQMRGRPTLLYTLHLSHFDFGRMGRWFTTFGDHVHVPSEDGRQWLTHLGRVPAERTTLIPHGIDTEKFPITLDADRRAARRALGLTDDVTIGTYVGRYDDPKNEGWLLDLAERSRAALPQLHLLLAGGGPHEAELRDRIARERLGDRVTLLGHHDPLPIYRAADAMLLPSAREGFSLACAEAMSTGLPVLRTRTAGTRELIVEGETGRSVPVDRDAFINGAISFLGDRPELARTGRLAATHVRQHFTFERQVQETVKLYRRLCGAAR
jgi:glycosyltransferase involved in cell wall biosynthesis